MLKDAAADDSSLHQLSSQASVCAPRKKMNIFVRIPNYLVNKLTYPRLHITLDFILCLLEAFREGAYECLVE